MYRKYILGYTLVVVAFLAPVVVVVDAQSSAKAKPVASKDKKSLSTNSHTGQYHSEGERIFMQNCSRCHTAPEGFSPRIAGTVVRHMRVRASLSQHDEQELLRFFNP